MKIPVTVVETIFYCLFAFSVMKINGDSEAFKIFSLYERLVCCDLNFPVIFCRYDYNELLQNSTFCLIPRGRRLGSFRFLESMKYGCIPVLLSNGWDLPFKDLIDWSKFSLNIDERNLLQLPSIIEGISEQMILSMRQQTLFIYKTYFSSVTNILNMMLEVNSTLFFKLEIVFLSIFVPDK